MSRWMVTRRKETKETMYTRSRKIGSYWKELIVELGENWRWRWKLWQCREDDDGEHGGVCSRSGRLGLLGLQVTSARSYFGKQVSGWRDTAQGE